MTTQPSKMWLELSRDDFLDAIRRLQPARMLKSYLNKELQIGWHEGQAMFSVEGAHNFHQARGQWTGFVCVPFAMVLPYLKVPPVSDPVRLVFEDGVLQIGTTRIKARRVAISRWIILNPPSPPADDPTSTKGHR